MTILVWGHRGHRHHRIPYKYPNAPFENSMAAFDLALATADGLECDVIRSADNTALMAHDMDTLSDGTVIYEMEKNLNAASIKILGERKIYEMQDAEIAQLKLVDGQSIPSLKNLLRRMKDFPNATLVIELKGPYTNEAALHEVENAISENHITPDQIIFSSFNFPALAALRKQVGQRFKIAPIFDMDILTLTQMFPEWPDAPQDAFYIPFRLDCGVLDLKDLQEMQPDYFHLERGSLTQNAIDHIHEKFPKAKINLWTVGEPHPDDDKILLDTIRQFAGSGKLHAVMTDFPEIVKTKLVNNA